MFYDLCVTHCDCVGEWWVNGVKKKKTKGEVKFMYT